MVFSPLSVQPSVINRPQWCFMCYHLLSRSAGSEERSLGLPPQANPRGKVPPDAQRNSHWTAMGLMALQTQTSEHKKEGSIIQAMPIWNCWKVSYIRGSECFGAHKIEILKTFLFLLNFQYILIRTITYC